MNLILIIVTTALVNNVVLSQFLGICSFLGVSSQKKASLSLGLAVMAVLTVSSAVANLLYTYVLLPLNLDNHNRIPTSYLRLLRRIVRDYETRGATVQHTISMWDSVRRGEQRWIFPFQENADVIFNSSTLYELAVLKTYIFPLLTAVQPEDSCYDEVRGIVKILNYVKAAQVDDEIPPTSLVREFIGGNTFYR